MITTPITADFIYGAVELEEMEGGGLRPHRLPKWARAQAADPAFNFVEVQAAGVRVAVKTAAQNLEILCHVAEFTPDRGALPRPVDVFDVVVDGRPYSRTSLTDTPEGHIAAITDLPAGEKRVEFWLPNGGTITLFSIRSDQPAIPAPRQGKRWVHYGSSISQGSAASHPSGTWVAQSAIAAGLDVTNLGFGGACQVDQFVARTMGALPADLLSVELGINVVNFDSMNRRIFRSAVHGFLDTLREAHPDVPLLVISPFSCQIHENTPGPGAWGEPDPVTGYPTFIATGNPEDVQKADKLSLKAIRKELLRIVALRATTDPQLTYVDGLELFGTQDEQRLPYRDRLHPDQEAHDLIAERFVKRLNLTPCR